MLKSPPFINLQNVSGNAIWDIAAINKQNKMKSKSFNTTKKTAFEVCKKTLMDFECDILSKEL